MNLAGVRPALREIPIGLIDEPTLPSRSTMDETRMDELVASIRSIGFISTIAVAQKGDRFEVIAGHRRRIAAGRAGIVAVPCLVYPSVAAGLEAIQHAENRHREELNTADEAIWFDELLKKYPDEGTDGVAARVGESRSYVESRLALFQGDEEVFNALADGKIGIGVAQQLNRVTQPQFRRSFLDQAIRNGATVNVVADWVRQWKQELEPATRDIFAPTADAPPGPPSMPSYFTCYACQSTDHPEHMRPVNVHDYCMAANVAPALEMWRRKSEYLSMPRTQADAVALIGRLLDVWPDIERDTSSTA